MVLWPPWGTAGYGWLRRYGIGWGTLRVAVGMGITAQLYTHCQQRTRKQLDR
jgi:hypothetical protein